METMHERIMNGKLFTDHCEKMPEERTQAKMRMHAFNVSSPEDTEGRARLLADIFGREVKAWVEPPIYFCYGRHIALGEGVYINCCCTFIDDGKIEIGDRTMFGPGVTVATVGHPVNPKLREYMYTDPVHIGKNCWIGAGVIICPGVTIGDDTVIGAGSVVVKDIPAGVVAAGNPCRVLRKIGERDELYYYKDRRIDPADIEEEAKLR